MIVFPETAFPRTLHGLFDRFETGRARGTTLEAWTFDDAPARRATEERLKRLGVEARIRSAYKPLLHFFLEEVERDHLADVFVRYPSHPAAAPNRFRLEAYPLAALIGNARLLFEPDETLDLTYDLDLRWRNGREERARVFAPNRLHVDLLGETLLSPTGWLRQGEDEGERLETDFEQLFAAALKAISPHDWGETEPFFEELNLRLALPFLETRLPVGDECLSLREALHEDLYFSLLEFFGHRGGRKPASRNLRPGQIVPEITFAPGQPTLRIETRPFCGVEPPGSDEQAEEATSPLSAAAVMRALAQIGGEPFEARSRTGRRVLARYVGGSDRPVLISGGQHANEPSGIVGALRAAKALKARRHAHFTVSPLENPDGQALHLRLCRDNPGHMQHAARYTAFGDDLEHRRQSDPGEHAIRILAQGRMRALLHINLHGYPAHEWTRPLSGYVPRGFAPWTLPKGFFLIMRHRQGWEAAARAMVESITRRLSDMPGLLAFNEAQFDLYRIHSGDVGFPIVNGFPCTIFQDDCPAFPLTLITEYPDETIHGQAFASAHAAQTEAALAAYDALQTLDIPALPASG